MKRGIGIGVPVIDGLWAGAVVANINGSVLAIELGADPLVDASWRKFRRDGVMLSHGIAYAVHSEADRERIVRSWHRRCGSLTECRCDQAVNLPLGPAPRPSHAPARPRQPMAAATARDA
jgi:hypothetical protein